MEVTVLEEKECFGYHFERLKLDDQTEHNSLYFIRIRLYGYVSHTFFCYKVQWDDTEALYYGVIQNMKNHIRNMERNSEAIKKEDKQSEFEKLRKRIGL